MRASVRLLDRNQDVVDAWKYQFEDVESSPDIGVGDVFDSTADALVVPGNAFGFLDRGLELELCERYGFELQDRLRDAIREDRRGELLVGQAIALPLEGAGYRFLIYTAQYRTPSSLDASLAAYLAARGAFMAVEESEESGSDVIERLVVPGIGTGGAGLHPAVSARQVRYAFEVLSGLRGYGDKNVTQLSRRARKLTSIPRGLLEETDGDA